MNSRFALPLAMLCLAGTCFAETVKDRAGAVRNDRLTMSKDTRWIYNDWRKGLEEAKWRGKPLLVVLRCVPCLACAGIDASVLNDPELQPLLDKFVCVRVMNANALDLELFQFDYDLSFSTMFFNGDGTVYGRYGSWTHQKNPQDKTTAGFKQALESALALHRAYPGNKAALAGKQGLPTPFKDPLQIPQLAGKYQRDLDWEGKVVQSCVHCHQVSDAIRSSYRDQKKEIPAAWIYPMPAPDTLGFKLAVDHATRVESVVSDSVAHKAGLRQGDDLVALVGQPVLSIADVSWALNRAPEQGAIPVTVKRGGKEQILNLQLTSGWRLKSDISRRVGTWPMRAMALGGLQLEELTEDERRQRNMDGNKMALRVKHAGQYGKHAAAKNAGFRANDVLLQVDGINDRITESELIGRLLLKHQAGTRVKATVLRGGERLELSLPMQ